MYRPQECKEIVKKMYIAKEREELLDLFLLHIILKQWCNGKAPSVRDIVVLSSLLGDRNLRWKQS
jgi:hypothetical protein